MKATTRIATLTLTLALTLGLAPRAGAGFEMPITFGGYTNQSEALTNFPVLVVFSNGIGQSGFSFSSHPFVTTNGYDLRFYTNSTDTGDGLDYEIESWNTNSASYVWVRVPLIPANGMGSIYAKWAGAASNQLACTTNGAVWTNGFAGVWHMGRTNAQDSTSNRNHGTSYANTNATGFIAGAQGFNGSSAYIDVGNGASVQFTGNKLTQSAWVNPAANVANGTILTKKSCYYFQRHSDQKLAAYQYGTTPAGYHYSTGTAPLNAWTHAAIVYDGSFIRFFLNGVESTNVAKNGNITSTADNLKIGWDTSASARYWNGLLDEVRLCGVARSTNWVWAEWFNMASNTMFNIYGTAGAGDTSSPRIQNRTASGVATNGATFNGYLETNGASAATVYVAWGQTNGLVSGAWAATNWWNPGDWTNGSCPATNMTLEANRQYFYQFGATNSTTNATASGYQYLITAGLTPTTTDGLCGPTYSETATISISRPGTLTNGALVVNYALSGSGTNYVSSSPASGFTLAAGEASRNIVFTPVAWNTGAVATVTLTMLPGAYASNDLGSAQVSVTNATTLTAASDTSIGTAMDVIENPPDTVTPTVVGTATNYDFFGLTLNLNGKNVVYNSGQRNVVLTNLAGIANGGSVDTSRSGANATGYIEIYASGQVAFTNNLTTRNGGNAVTGRILVNATDIRVDGSVLTDNASSGLASGPVTLTATAGNVAITNCIATYNHGGGVDVRAGAVAVTASRVTIGGTNSYGYAIDAHGGSAAGQHLGGGPVTIKATSGVTLSTGGISTYGKIGGDVTISDGAAGSAGDIYIGGNILSYNNEINVLPGAQTLIGANIRVTGYMDADQKGSGVVTPAFAPIAIVGSGSVRVEGYITDSRTVNSGGMSGDHSVRIQGASVTVGGTNTSGYSVLAMNACSTAGEKADNISLIATAGDITVAGGYDASAVSGSANFGTVTNIASGNITIGSLNAGRFKAITLMAGQGGGNWIYVTGVLTNFTVSESLKKFTFPTGSVVSNDVYYSVVNNGVGLSGTYSIYVSTADTGKKLLVGPPGAGGNPPIMVNGAATNQTATTAALIGTMASTGTAASVAYVFWSTTDCTNNEAAWLSTGGGVSNFGQRAQGEVFTNTISGLTTSTRYFYNFMGSNSVGKGWAATNVSASFWTDGAPGVGTNVGATAIGAFSATLNGILTNCVSARVFVYYGTDYNNWAHTNDLGWRGTGTFSTAASGLSAGALCYYRCLATNNYGSATSAVASFTTVAPATNTMTGDVYIGNVLAGISAAGATPYTYDFGGYLTLNMGGYKLYCNDQQRDVCVTNVLGIANGGSVDTSRPGSFNSGYIEIFCAGPVAFTNNLTTRNGGNVATGRITVNATDVVIGNSVLTDNLGWNGSAGAVTINAPGGSIGITNVVATFNHSAGGLTYYAGTVTMNAGSIRVGGAAGGYAIDASGTGGGMHQGGMPVTLTATNGVTLATGGIATYGYGGGNVSVVNSGPGGISIGGTIKTLSDEGTRVAGNILLSTASGDITVTGGYDAYCLAGAASYGTVTNIAGGNITIGSLDASRFKAITLMAGQTGTNWIYVTGVLTNFTVSESPKKFTFPAGSVVSNDIYYSVVNNGVGLSGTYDIYVSMTDTGKKLLVGPPGAGGNPPIMVNGAATNQTDTTAALVGTMASTGTAASVAYVFWSTTDCTNNEAAWLSTGGGVSDLGQRAQGEVFTNTIGGLTASTRYFYNFMGSNSVGKGWAATNASPSFWTDGAPGVGTNVGATAIGAFSATLNGILTNCVSARVFVYYGTDYNNWAYTNDLGWRGTGTFSTAASGLSAGALCYYRCLATNTYGSATSAVASFTTVPPSTNTMTGDVLVGDPLAGINAAGTTPYTYDFGAYRALDMGGYKLYRNDQQRDVRVTNVLAILNGGSVDTSLGGATGYIELYASGAVAFTNNLTTRNGANAATGRILVNATDIRVGGSVLTDNVSFGGQASGPVTLTATAGDVAITNCITTYNHGGGVSVNAGAVAVTASRVTIGGTNSYGYAIDAHGGSAAGQHIGGGAVTIKATNGVTLSTGGIATYGKGGGAVTISDGAGGPAGDISIGGNVLSYNNEGLSLPGTQTLIGANIRVSGYMDADQKGSGVVTPAFAPIVIQGSGSVRVDGYISASRTVNSGGMTGDHSVRIQGASVTVGGVNANGYSVLAMNACGTSGEKADNISLIATAGDITVAGGYDASAVSGGANNGTVTNIASGNITIGSLDAGRFKAITLIAGQSAANWIYVTGVLTNFTTNASPKRIVFPAGSTVSNDVFYRSASNTMTGLTGMYAIYVGAADTGKQLRDGGPWSLGTVFKFR